MSRIGRLFVVDPVRHDRRGHHWHFAEGVLREAERRDFEPRFFVARSAGGRPLPGPGFHPIFRHGLYRPVTGDRNEDVGTDYRIGSTAFSEDLAGCAEFDPGARDLIVIPTASLRIVGGIAKWRAATGCATPVVFLFHDLLPAAASVAPGSPGAAIAREAGEALQTSGLPFIVGSTNDTLADLLHDAMGVAVETLPLPHWYDLAAPQHNPVYRPPDHGFLAVAMPGELRREKGGHLAPDIAALVCRMRYRARLVVQTGDGDPGLAEPLRELARRGEVDLIEGNLSEPAFARFLQDVAMILLPYDRARYGARISGPFAFAAAIGRPCIVPDGTWMARQIEAGQAAGIVYRGETAIDIATAIGNAIEQLPVLTALAARQRENWRILQSGPALLTRLVDWAESIRPAATA